MEKLVRLQTLANEWSACQKCPLLCHERKNVVFGYGQYEKVPIFDQATGRQVGLGGQIMVVGEAPGTHEDETGVPFVGKSGMLLNRYLASVSARSDVKGVLKEINNTSDYEKEQALDYQLRQLLCQEIFITNVISCHPPENRDPTPKEIASCRSRLMETIYIVDPVIIIGVGRVAVESLIGKRISITQVRGELFDISMTGRLISYRYPLIATLHPSYLMRKNDFNQKGGDGAKTFHDFMKAVKIVDAFNFRNYGIPHPHRDEED